MDLLLLFCCAWASKHDKFLAVIYYSIVENYSYDLILFFLMFSSNLQDPNSKSPLTAILAYGLESPVVETKVIYEMKSYFESGQTTPVSCADRKSRCWVKLSHGCTTHWT